MGVDVRDHTPVSTLQASAWAVGIPASWRAMGFRVFCVTENYGGLARFIKWGVCDVYIALIQNSLTLNLRTYCTSGTIILIAKFSTGVAVHVQPY